MAKDTKKKSSSNAGNVYDIRIQGSGFITLEGIADDDTGSAILFRHRRPSSSKWQIKTIPKRKIVSMPDGIGKHGKLIYRDENAIALRVRKGSVEGSDKNNPGFIKVATEEGKSFLVNPEFMNAITVSEVDAPSDTGKKSSKKKASTKKAA